ncbi:MAG: DUF433 domain-containing protein [Candidatus Nanohaloarchaea archaeon]
MPEAVDRESVEATIVEDQDTLGGAPHIGGTRVRVSDIAVRYQSGESPEEIVDTFPGLDFTEVYAALSYYHRNPGEIEDEIADREDRFEQAAS